MERVNGPQIAIGAPGIWRQMDGCTPEASAAGPCRIRALMGATVGSSHIKGQIYPDIIIYVIYSRRPLERRDDNRWL